MFVIYQILLAIGLVLASPYLLFRALVGKHGLRERLGFWNFVPDGRKTVWFHSASVGELKIISTILPELQKMAPELRFVITSVTKTGRENARKLNLAAEHYYLPIDFKLAVDRVIARVKPELLVIVETELWPALIRRAHHAGARVVIANGRISKKSFQLYELAFPLIAPVLEMVDFVMAQTKDDATKYTMLGIWPTKVAVYGNAKFDQIADSNHGSLAPELAEFVSGDEHFIFVAGSVRAQEFGEITESVRLASSKIERLKVVLAPRHLKDLGDLEFSLQAAELSYRRRTSLGTGPGVNQAVLVLDTMGELSQLYRHADLAFVGGSLAKIGGHDPLEPASVGCAVCFGPHMDNSRQFADLLVQAGGAVYVKNGRELAELIQRLAADPSQVESLAGKAKQSVLSHVGVSRRIAEKLVSLI